MDFGDCYFSFIEIFDEATKTENVDECAIALTIRCILWGHDSHYILQQACPDGAQRNPGYSLTLLASKTHAQYQDHLIHAAFWRPRERPPL
ncbi:MAG: hypothetical protein ACXWJW_16145, partial [Xanthobacteraceae bacterium]